MPLDEILRNIDRQIEEKREREKKFKIRGERRQESIPVAVERRSGRDRRKSKRES